GGGDERVVAPRVAQVADRARGAGDAGLEVDHQLGLGRKVRLGGARQRQDPADIAVVQAQQFARGGVLAGVEGGVGQAGASLGEVADVAVEVGQVEVGAEVE